MDISIMDSSAILYIVNNEIHMDGDYYITPDIEDEISINEISTGRRISEYINLKSYEELVGIEEASYLFNYQYVLNKYSGKSFYNMTGFGDISLIALAKTIISKTNSDKQPVLLKEYESNVVVYSNDRGFIKRIRQELGNQTTINDPRFMSKL